jgi:DNA-binding MarR family transcriptional regulator
VLVGLTDAGIEKVDSALSDHAANELALIDELDPDERATLIGLLRKLHHKWSSAS